MKWNRQIKAFLDRTESRCVAEAADNRLADLDRRQPDRTRAPT
jgi:hypothetical protein